MTFEQVTAWFKENVPAESRKAVLGYALQLCMVAESREKIKSSGVSENTLKMVEMAAPMLALQLGKIIGV